MKIAVPLFGKEVAPRFCFADEYLMVEIESDSVKQSRTIVIVTQSWHEGLATLSDLGVNVLLCGGFNRNYRPLAQDLGIEVLSGLSGEAHVLIETYINEMKS